MRRTSLILGLTCLAAVATGVSVNELPTYASAFEGVPADNVAKEPEFSTVITHGQRYALSSRQAIEASRSQILPAGVRSLMMMRRTLRHGDYVWNDEDVPTGPIQIWVDLRRQMISVFRGGHEIGTAVVIYGRTEGQTPTGHFQVLSKRQHYRSRKYEADMPYSLFISGDGVALHAAVMEPRRATHGCIGLPEEFARLLFEAAAVGAAVDIVRSGPSDFENRTSL